jgi:photosystem II stability/assembly factor-like uncharacterized protein
MILRTRLAAPLLALALILGFLVAAPVVAHAADSLAWQWPLPFTGPLDIPNPNPERPATPVAGGFNGVSFAGALNGWAVGVQVVNPASTATRSGIVYATHNSGSTWAPESVDTTHELNAVCAFSATDVWVVGMTGAVYHWDGSAWAAQTIPGWDQSKHLYGVAFATAELGWAVGDGMSVVRTTDGGNHWSVVTAPSGTSALRAVAAADGSSAIAVGDNGTMKRLLSTGIPPAVYSGTSSNLYGVTFASASRAWAVGAGATIIRSTDGGVNWDVAARPIPSGTPAAALLIRSVAFAGAYDGIAVSTLQFVWRTIDGGYTWTAEQMPAAGWLPDLELRGAAFAGSADAPVAVSRHAFLDLSTVDQKARVHLGSWTGRAVPLPAAPTDLAAVDGGSPRPRVTLNWTDNAWDEDGFTVQRSNGSTANASFSTVANLAADAGSWTDPSADWRSTWYYRVRSYRGTYASAWTVSPGIAVDNIAPVTTAEIAGSYIESATIVLVPHDNAGGSGVARTRYVLDHAPAVTGTSLTVSAYGPHTIAYWSDDVAGNSETPVTVDFTIVDPSINDSEPPVTDAFVEPYYTGPASIQFTATDMPMFGPASGVAYTYCTFDGGTRHTGSSAPVPQVPGTREVTYWSVDARGNEESPHKTESFFVDLADPVTTSNAAALYYKAGTITLTPSDPGGAGASGVARTLYSVDDGVETSGTSVAVPMTHGTHHIDFHSVDKAGRVESTKTSTFEVSEDNAPPFTTPAAAVAAYYTSSASISLVATDNGGSGVAQTYYRLDTGAWTPGTSVTTTKSGAHTLYFRSVDVAGNSEADQHVDFTVRIATGVSITSNHTSIVHRHPVAFSGHISSNRPHNTHVEVWVKRPGSSVYVRLSTRHSTSSHHWSYTYSPSTKGTWYFQARYGGSPTYWAPSTSSTRTIKVR